MLFNLVCLDISWVSIIHPSQKLCRLKLLRAFVVEFRMSQYIMGLNHTAETKVMPFEFIKSLCFSILNVSIYHGPQSYTQVKIMAAWICRELLCSISSILIYYAPESDIRMKSYDHLNISRTLVVQFRTSRYIMRFNQTSEWQVMTIWISRELLLFKFERLDISWGSIIHPSQKLCRLNLPRASVFNFERLDILCTWVGYPSEKLWPFEFIESFRYSISSVSIYHGPQSNTWVKSYGHLNFPKAFVFNFEFRDILCAWIRHPVKSYDHLNFSGAFIVQFRMFRYIICFTQTSEWQVMTIWISREVMLFNFERLDISWGSVIHPSQMLWLFEFSESFRVQVGASRYIIHLNRISNWKVMTIWISRQLPVYTLERLDILWACIGHSSKKLWPFEFLERFCYSFSIPWYMMGLNRTSNLKVIAVWICRELPCLILSDSIYFTPETNIRLKSYDHLNFTRASVVQFQMSRHIMHVNQPSECKVMTIWISRVLLLFNFECLNILWASFIHPSQKLCRLKLLRAYVVQFRMSRYIMGLNHTPESKVMLFEFIKSFCFSTSNVSIYHGPQSYTQVKSYGV